MSTVEPPALGDLARPVNPRARRSAVSVAPSVPDVVNRIFSIDGIRP